MTALPSRLDSLSMFEAVATFPEQVEAAAVVASDLDGLPERQEIEHVVLIGMGGSGIAADVVATVAGPFMPVPVIVTKGYEPPSFVNESTLCIALSFSGQTEETLEAASTAASLGARMVVISRAGELSQLAQSWGAPYVRVPAGIPMPRAGMGAMAVPALTVLEQTGLFPGASQWIDLALEQARRRRDELMKEDNPARTVAGRIGRTMPIIYAGNEVGAVAALRWKNQINENAKSPAFCGVIPEMTHNEICGWGQHGDVTRQIFTVVMLRHDHEHPQVMRRFELVRDWIAEVVAGVVDVHAEGDGALAQLFDLVLLGDFVSLHMAFQEGIDPGPVPVLDHFKSVLAGPEITTG